MRISEQEWALDAGLLAAQYLRILKRKPNKGWASLTSAHGIVSVMGLAMKLSQTRAFAPLDQRRLTRTRGVLPAPANASVPWARSSGAGTLNGGEDLPTVDRPEQSAGHWE